MRASLMIPTLIAITAFAIAGNTADVPSRLEGVFLVIDGTAACVSEAELFRRLERHAPKARRAARGERARRFRVEFLAQGDIGVTARLHVRGHEGTETTRELPARSCDEAAEAAALVIALTLTPSGESQSSPIRPAAAPTPATTPSSGGPQSSSPSAVPPAAISAGSASAASAPSAAISAGSASAASASATAAGRSAAALLARESFGIEERQGSLRSAAAESSASSPKDGPGSAAASGASGPSAPRASRPALSPPPTPGPATGMMNWRPVFTVRATAKSGATPEPVMGMAGAVGLVPSRAAGWVPSFEIAFERTAVGRKDYGLTTGPIDIGVALSLARAEACIPRWGLARLSAAACLVGALGKMDVQATGESLGPSGRAGNAWWSGAGLWGRMQVAVAAGFRLELGVGGMIPFWRYSVRLSAPSVIATAGPTFTSPFRANGAVLGAELGVSWTVE